MTSDLDCKDCLYATGRFKQKCENPEAVTNEDFYNQPISACFVKAAASLS
jgi:hypothetical protein